MKFYTDPREDIVQDVKELKVESTLKLPRLILSLLRIRKIWTLPKKCDVLIFNSKDNNPIEVGLTQILSSYGNVGRFTLPNDGEVNLPILLLSILKRGIKFSAYCDSYIQRVDPKLVITYIDNNATFYPIASRNPSVKTMFIQNGTRGYKVFKALASVLINPNL